MTSGNETIKHCKKSNISLDVPSLTDLLIGTNRKEDCLLKGMSITAFVAGFIEVNGEVDLQSSFIFDSDLLLKRRPLKY